MAENGPSEMPDIECPGCGGRDWSLASKPVWIRLGFRKGWNWGAVLQCTACGRQISAGWGGGIRVPSKRRRLPRRLHHSSAPSPSGRQMRQDERNEDEQGIPWVREDIVIRLSPEEQ